MNRPMTQMNRGTAIAAFSKLDLTETNLRLARYWLSLWPDDATLPLRSQFNPARIKDLLPGVGIFEVRVGESSRCRLAGTAIQTAISREIAGCDWRDYTAKEDWAARLERNSAIATGAVGVGVRRGQSPVVVTPTQEVHLPFADTTEDGARLILFHLDWRPAEYVRFEGKDDNRIKVADQFHTISLFAA